MRRLAKSSTLWMLVIVIGLSVVYAVIRERDPMTGDIDWWGVSVRTVVVAGLAFVLICLYEVAIFAINRRRSKKEVK